MGALTFLEADHALSIMALAAAVEAGSRDEIPVGAVLTDCWGRVLSQAGNSSIGSHDPVGHAEIIVLRKAGCRVDNYRLSGTRLIVSLQPCPLCFQAVKIARVSKVLFVSGQTGVSDAAHNGLSVEHLGKQLKKNPIFSPIMQASSEFLRFFFARRRGI